MLLGGAVILHYIFSNVVPFLITCKLKIDTEREREREGNIRMHKVLIQVFMELEESDADLNDCKFLRQMLEPVIRPLERVRQRSERVMER